MLSRMRCFVLLLMACEGSFRAQPPADRAYHLEEKTVGDVPTSGARRLTHAEYDASVRALLGDDVPIDTSLLPAESTNPFDNDPAFQPPSLAFVESAELLARDAASWYAANHGSVDVDALARRALRRPLDASERVTLSGLDVQGVVQALLFHTAFLYRLDTGDAWARASKLAYFLTGRGPDDILLDAAANGDFDVRAQADRLLSTDAAREHWLRFHAMWLGYVNLADRGDTDVFVEQLAFGDRDYAELVGVLGHPSVLRATSPGQDTSPTRRGKYVRERWLCDTIPPPPPGVDVDAPPTAEGVCKKDRYARHRTEASCASCHRLMDPIGFGLEQYDRLGQHRDHDDGRPECALDGVGDVDGETFTGPAELGTLIIGSGKFEACVVQHVVRHALGRSLTHDDDVLIEKMRDGFAHNDRRFRSLLLDVAEVIQ